MLHLLIWFLFQSFNNYIYIYFFKFKTKKKFFGWTCHFFPFIKYLFFTVYLYFTSQNYTLRAPARDVINFQTISNMYIIHFNKIRLPVFARLLIKQFFCNRCMSSNVVFQNRTNLRKYRKSINIVILYIKIYVFGVGESISGIKIEFGPLWPACY